ncbi:MAG: hypothetical protein QOJ65_182 [Fimbriimonadaceae bacterium]|nr:hypothetical protein [Fimbriimonadaceae bacterium]
MREDWLLQAVSVLIQMGLPKGTEIPDINLNALRNAYNEGYFKCLANLELLRSVKQLETKPMPKAWEHGDKPK